MDSASQICMIGRFASLPDYSSKCVYLLTPKSFFCSRWYGSQFKVENCLLRMISSFLAFLSLADAEVATYGRKLFV